MGTFIVITLVVLAALYMANHIRKTLQGKGCTYCDAGSSGCGCGCGCGCTDHKPEVSKVKVIK